jgi:phage terminase large subunit GpA-like protein
VLHGDPAQPAVWQALDTLTLRSFRTQSGRTLRIRSVCIDTGGHHAAQVFSFCRARRARRMFPTKGAAGPRPIWPKRASRAGSKGADTVFIVGVDTAKDAIYGRLRIAEPGPGYVHFPASEGFDDAYFEQLTSEQVVTRYREGRPYRVWVLQKGRRNEALDTFVLALAALRSLPIRLETIPAPDRPEPPPDQSPPPADPFTAAPPRNRNPMPSRGGGFLQRRRGWLS